MPGYRFADIQQAKVCGVTGHPQPAEILTGRGPAQVDLPKHRGVHTPKGLNTREAGHHVARLKTLGRRFDDLANPEGPHDLAGLHGRHVAAFRRNPATHAGVDRQPLHLEKNLTDCRGTRRIVGQTPGVRANGAPGIGIEANLDRSAEFGHRLTLGWIAPGFHARVLAR